MSESQAISLAGTTARAAQVRADAGSRLPGARGSDVGAAFRDVLGLRHSAAGGADQARAAAEQFVAQALVKPVLAELRSNNRAEGPFAPGPYEKQFGPLVDHAVAEQLVKSQRWGIVDAVERQLRREGLAGIPGV